MGGYGSGRYPRESKRSVESLPQIDANAYKKAGGLTYGIESIILTGQQIRLEWSRCRYGGWRLWFHCPRCDRRCVKLYQRMGIYRCRQCSNVNYLTSQVSGTAYDDLLVAARRVSRDLGDREWFERFQNDWELAFMLPPAKPKWMRWKTYQRHWAKFESAVGRHRAKFRADLRRYVARLD